MKIWHLNPLWTVADSLLDIHVKWGYTCVLTSYLDIAISLRAMSGNVGGTSVKMTKRFFVIFTDTFYLVTSDLIK